MNQITVPVGACLLSTGNRYCDEENNEILRRWPKAYCCELIMLDRPREDNEYKQRGSRNDVAISRRHRHSTVAGLKVRLHAIYT